MTDYIGHFFGNYHLLRQLGRGGQASVYLGEHRYLEVLAAIKVLHVQMEPPGHERFRREARTIAHLQHPHIVRVLDFGIQDLTPFLVMEYIPGGTLRMRHPKGTHLSFEQVVHYVNQIAAALDYAHQHHVIHRDVKPENLLLNAQQEIVLSDFGLAVVQDTLESLSTPDQAGTPAYMAPEQIQRNPCPASDQYALGVLVYEWLCGQPPFRGSLFEVMNQHLHQAPPSLREQLPALASAVEQVVLKALAKEPGQRFESIVAFAAALEKAMGLGQTAGANQPLLGRTVAPDSSAPYIGRRSQRPLVGREQEQRRLHHLLLAAEQPLQTPSVTSTPVSLAPAPSSRSAGVVLLGEAGIGKTRLAEEVSREAQQRGWIVLWSRAYLQEQAIPYQPWIEALRHAISQVREVEQEVNQHPLRYHPLTTLLPELAEWFPKDAMPPMGDSEHRQRHIWEALLALLTAMSHRMPLLLVLDDLHWMDGSSCALLGYVARRLSMQRLLLIGTCRPTELSPTHPLHALLTDLQREGVLTLLPLGRLTDAQIGTLIADVSPALIQDIQQQAAGNPLFAEELARHVGGQFMRADHLYRLPTTIGAVLDQRIRNLSSPCQQLLSRAAVLGGSFEFKTLQAMETKEMDEGTLLDLLEEALQAGMLTEEDRGMHTIYHFWHPLLVSHLYDGLSAVRRTSLHHRAAEGLQQIYSGHDHEEEAGAAIVYHLVSAGGSSPQIAHYAGLAGDRAYLLSAYPEAEYHYRTVLEHMGQHTYERAHRASILELLGECIRIQGKYEEARRIFEQTLEVRAQHPAGASQVERQQEAQIDALLWCEIGSTWNAVGDNAQARQCYERSERVLQEAGVVSGPAWAKLHYAQSYAYWMEGNYDEARAEAHEALKLFEEATGQQRSSLEDISRSTAIRRTLAGDPVNLGRAYSLLGIIEALSGRSGDALIHFNTALALFEQYDCQREIAIACCNAGDAYLRKADYSQAQAVLRRSLSIAEHMGDIHLTSCVVGNLGVLDRRLGNLTEAETEFKRSITLAERFHDPISISMWHTCLATVLQEQGKLLDAKAALSRALAVGRATHSAPCIGLALVTAGSLRIAQAIVMDADGEDTAASQEEKFRILKHAGKTLQHALSLEGLETETRIEGQLAQAQVSLLLGEVESALQQARQALEDARLSELTWLVARAQRILGSVFATQGEQEQAKKYFEQALRTFHEHGMRLEWAHTLSSYGEALLQSSHSGDAQYQQGLRYLQDAQQALRECHAVLDLQMVDRLLSTQRRE